MSEHMGKPLSLPTQVVAAKKIAPSHQPSSLTVGWFKSVHGKYLSYWSNRLYPTNTSAWTSLQAIMNN